MDQVKTTKPTSEEPGIRCPGCPLQDCPVVPAWGSRTPRVVLVGEAPGADEVVQGRPFTGKSGQLLRKLLRRNGVNDETEVYWTNTIQCRPPDNRNPKVSEINACNERLNRELHQVVNPSTVIIATGNFAAKTLTGRKEGITKLRLLGVQTHGPTGAKMICTFHPAATLRNPDYFPSLVKDIEKLIQPATITWQPTNYRVLDSVLAASRYLMSHSFDKLAVDVEIGTEEGHGHAHDFEWLCIGLSHRPGHAAVFTKEVLEDQTLRHALAHRLTATPLIFQNGKFDIQFLWKFAPTVRVSEDSMLLSYAIDERKGTHDLEQLSTEYLNAPYYKTEAKQFLPKADSPLALLPKDVLYKYNAFDVDHTHRLIAPLTKRMQAEGTERAYRRLMIPASNVLAKMEYHGVAVDWEGLDGLEDEFIHALQEMETRFEEWGVNPRSPQQIKKALGRMGFQVPSTGAEILEDIDSDFARTILEYRKRHKLLSTYIQGLKSRLFNGRVHPSFLIHGTESGRLSCRNPNLQNIVRGSVIRDLYVASPGTQLVEADYSQIELRCAAYYSKDPWLTRQFQEGISVHHATAVEMFGEDYNSEQYVISKSINFGVLYGESPKHLAYRLGISPFKAAEWIKQYMSRSPKLWDYRRSVEHDITTKGHLQTPYGRKRRFWLITDDNWYDLKKEGYNFPIQSMASDILLESLIELDNELSSPTYRGAAIPLLTVHDQILLETHDVELTTKLLKEVMERTIEGIPFTIETKVGERWGSLKKV